MTSAIVLFLTATTLPAGELTVGASQTDITPARGTPMAGYYSARAAEGTHDPLYAKVIVMEQDGTRAVLIGLDLISTTADLTAATRKQIEATTKIPGTHVMLFATHAHTGPVLSEKAVYASVVAGSGPLLRDYLGSLPGKIAEAVAKADAARVPARVMRGIGQEDGLAFNRRFHMLDGSVGWNPGKKNPNIIKPAGPTDASVPVVQFVTTDKQPRVIANYVNFAMHADTVGGMQFSADYMGYLAGVLGKAHGDQAVTVFGAGCCGDVNHVNVSSDRPQKGHGEAARIGGRLAGEVLRVCDRMTPANSGPLVVSSATVELALPAVTEEDIKTARAVKEAILKDVKPAPKSAEQVQAFKVLDVSERLGKPQSVEVQVISLGDELAWVSLPGEVFVDLGLQIKAGSPFKQTMINELANGSIGYIPTKLAYSQGNYEVNSSRCAEGSGEALVAEAAKQLRARFQKVPAKPEGAR